MTLSKEDLLLKAFYEYSIFFENENKISLLDKRDFKLIYAFKVLFEYILDKDTDIITVSKMLIIIRRQRNGYFAHIKETFSQDIITHTKSTIVFTNYNTNIKNRDKVLNIFDTSMENISNFFKAYSLLSQYKSITYIEELLIEFNNFLSHITQSVINENNSELNIQRANAHLHRAILDSFKVIIHESRIKIRYDQDLLGDFLDIRSKELELIGDIESNNSSNTNKNDIQILYYKFVVKNLT